MGLNNSDKRVIAEIEAMTAEEARRLLAGGHYGQPGSPNHDFASQWVLVREATEQREQYRNAKLSSDRTLKWTMAASIAAIVAALLSFIAVLK